MSRFVYVNIDEMHGVNYCIYGPHHLQEIAEPYSAPVTNRRSLVDYTYPQVRPRQEPVDDFAPFEVRRYGRHWEVRDPSGEVVCLTVYRRGAAEVVRRLKLGLGQVVFQN